MLLEFIIAALFRLGYCYTEGDKVRGIKLR